MKLRVWFIAFGLGLALTGCVTTRGGLSVGATVFPYDTTTLSEEEARRWQEIWYNAVHISLIHLIATPKVFDRKPVRVTGIIMTTEFGVLLFLDRDSYEHMIDENAVSIVLEDSHLDTEMLPAIEGKFVEVVGEFRDEPGNSLYFTNGCLYDVLPIKFGDIKRPVVESKP